MISIDDNKKKRFILNTVFALALAVIIFILLKYAVYYFLPFIIGLIIALTVEPLVKFFVKKFKFNRKIASVISVLSFVVFISLLIFLLISIVTRELMGLTKMLPYISEQIPKTLDQFKGKLSGALNSLPPSISVQADGMLANLIAEFVKIPTMAATNILKGLGNAAASLPAIILTFIISLVSSIFFSMDYPKIRAFFLRQIPERHHHIAIDVKFYTVNTIGKLIRAYATLMFITFVELSIGLTIFRIPYAITIALTISFVDIFPVLGSGTVLIPWSIIAFIMGNTKLGISLLILYAFILIVRNALEPKIVGHNIGLHPLVTLFAIVIGLELFGLVGILTFPITIIILKNLQDSGKVKIWN
jgi:sporulation integral membrane protein YtvI